MIKCMSLILLTTFFSLHTWATELQVQIKIPESPNGVHNTFSNQYLSIELGLNAQNELAHFNFQDKGFHNYPEGPAVKVPISSVRGKSYKVKISNIELGTIQGLNMNQIGEGTLRILPKSQFLAAGVPQYLDVDIRRVGPFKKWVVIANNQIVRSAQFELDKNIYDINLLDMLFSGPKVVKMELKSHTCSWDELAKIIKQYESASLFKLLNCKSPFGASFIANTINSTLATDSLYTDFYISPNKFKTQAARLPQRLQVLKEIGMDVEKLNPEFFLNTTEVTSGAVDFLGSVSQSGNLEMLESLLNLGFRPSEYAYTDALLNVFQMDFKKGQIVKSHTGSKIFELVRNKTVSKTTLAHLLYQAFALPSETVDQSVSQSKKIHFSYISALLDLIESDPLLVETQNREGESLQGSLEFGRSWDFISESEFQVLLKRAKAL